MSQCAVTLYENTDCDALDTFNYETITTSLNTCINNNSTIQSVEIAQLPGCPDSFSDIGYLLVYNAVDCSGSSWNNVSQFYTCLRPGATGLDVKSVQFVCAAAGPDGFAVTASASSTRRSATSEAAPTPSTSVAGNTAMATGSVATPTNAGSRNASSPSGLSSDGRSALIGVCVTLIVMILIFMFSTPRRNAITFFKTWFSFR